MLYKKPQMSIAETFVLFPEGFGQGTCLQLQQVPNDAKSFSFKLTSIRTFQSIRIFYRLQQPSSNEIRMVVFQTEKIARRLKMYILKKRLLPAGGSRFSSQTE